MSDTTNGGAQRLKGRSFAETRGAVLDLIRSEGEISRSDLARRSSLTEKTISVIVKSLIEAGVVIEAGFAQSTGGKRPVLLRLNNKELYAVGISLFIARCVLVVCNLDGAEVARSEIRGYGTDEPLTVLKRISTGLNRLLQRHGINKESVLGICMAMGGRRQVLEAWPVETATDRWETYPVEIELQRLTGLSVIRENDAHCAALGEYWTAGDASRDFVTVYMAEGVGAGILIGGQIYRGSSGSAGEISHIQVESDGPPCRCGRRGCLATVATPQALVARIAADPRLAEACGVTSETTFRERFRRFCDAVQSGVPEAVQLFETAANQLASVILDLVNTLDLNLVTLAGPGFTQLGEEYQSRIQRRLNESAYLREVHPITVRLGAGGADAAALGAASVVLHRNLTPHHTAL